MLLENIAQSWIRTAILTSLFFSIAGCLPSSEADVPADVPVDDPSGGTPHRLTGSVGDGPITNADVHVNARDGRSLVITNSSATASYDISVVTDTADYPLAVLAVGGTDIVTMTVPDFDMKSAVKNLGENSIANINPFTTVAIALASDLQGGLTPSNIDIAMQIVVRELNSGLSTMSGSTAMQSAVTGSNIAELTRASEALGELVRRVRDALGAAGFNETGNDIVTALGSDLTDGVLDGRGGPRANARIAAVAGMVRGQIALETLRNELRVQGADGTARIQNAMVQVFSGNISPSLAELPVTGELLESLRLGTIAANALQQSTVFDTLLSDMAAVSAGMTSAQARARVSSDALVAYDNGILAIAAASAVQIAMINEIIRTGETPSQNAAPVINGSPATSARVGIEYDFVPTATDSDGDLLTFSISGRPDWATFDTVTGRMGGAPQPADVGTYQGIVISTTDGQETASLPAFTLTVTNAASNTPPEISGNPATQATVGIAYSFQPAATDSDGDSLTFSIANQPSWASFDTETGVLGGTPGDADTGTWSNIVISVSDGEDSASLAAFTIVVDTQASENTPPTISGSPATQVLANSAYDFTPEANDADGDTLTFSVQGLPGWASFDTSTGRLWGTPGDADVATYSGISISVSDGQDTATLGPFSITVDSVTTGSATLSWTPPTLNTDGTPLTDLAGYRIYWGTSSGVYTNSVTLNNPGLSSYVVENLPTGAWYFVSTALNVAGVESSYSNEAVKTIQ